MTGWAWHGKPTYPPSLKYSFTRYGNLKGVKNFENEVVWGHPSLSAMLPFDRAHGLPIRL